MSMPSNPHSLASQTLKNLLNPGTACPRPWLDLPAETRKQIAQSIAPLLLRMRPARTPTKADRHVESVE